MPLVAAVVSLNICGDIPGCRAQNHQTPQQKLSQKSTRVEGRNDKTWTRMQNLCFSVFKRHVRYVNPILSPIYWGARSRVLKNCQQPWDHQLAILFPEKAVVCLECFRVVSVYSFARHLFEYPGQGLLETHWVLPISSQSPVGHSHHPDLCLF